MNYFSIHFICSRLPRSITREISECRSHCFGLTRTRSPRKMISVGSRTSCGAGARCVRFTIWRATRIGTSSGVFKRANKSTTASCNYLRLSYKCKSGNNKQNNDWWNYYNTCFVLFCLLIKMMVRCWCFVIQNQIQDFKFCVKIKYGKDSTLTEKDTITHVLILSCRTYIQVSVYTSILVHTCTCTSLM